MSLARRFLRGSILNLLDQALRFVAVFIMTPIIVAALGKEQYGFWILLMSILGNYALLDFGLSFSISRFFSRAIGRGDETELHSYINSALSILLRVGLIALALTVLGVVVCPAFIDDASTLSMTRWIIVIYGVYLSLGFPVRVFRSLLKSHLRYDLLVLGSATQIITANVLIFYFLHKGHGVFTLVVVNAAVGFLEHLIVLVAAFRTERSGIPLKRSLVDPARRKELLRYSATSFVTNLGYDLRNRIDPIILGSFVGLTAVSHYALGMRFPIFLTDLIGAVLGGQLLAVFSQTQGRSERGEGDVKGRFLMATRVSTIVAVFCGTSLVFYGEVFLQRWLGERYHPSIYHVMAILTVPYIFSLMQYPTLSFIYALAKHKFLAITAITGGVCNLILSFILVQFFDIYGVVWATFVEMLVVYLVIFPLIVCRVGGIPLKTFYIDTLGVPLLACALILTPFYLISHRFLEADYGRLATLGSAQALYFAPLALLVILNDRERGLLFGSFRKRAAP